MPEPTEGPEPTERSKAGGGKSLGWRGLAGDASGGIIAALIALPYGLAMARLMGLPPALGLFTSIATAPITALLGRNPVLIGGTASATVPFIAAGTAYGVSRLFEDTGGHFWYAVLASFIAEMAIDGLGLGLLLGEEAAFAGSGGSLSSGGSAVIATTEILLGVAHLVVIPLAASFGLHFGQDVVPQRSWSTVTPTPAPGGPPPQAPMAPPNPQLTPPPPPPVPPSYPSTMMFPLFQLRFG